VACIYDNWQSIIKELPDALNAHGRNGCSPADSNQIPRIPEKRLDEKWQTNREVLNEVMRRVIKPPTLEPNPDAESEYYNVLCADGNFWCCKSVFATRLEDCPENSDLHHL